MDTPSVQSLGLTLLLLYAHTVLWIELATEVLSPQLPWIKQSCPYPQKNSFTSVWGSSEKDLKIPVYGPNNENILLQVIYKDSPLWWERVGSWEGGFKKKNGREKKKGIWTYEANGTVPIKQEQPENKQRVSLSVWDSWVWR